MAEIKQGILGPINGKIATVVGAIWRGRNILRAKPRKSKKKATMPQLLQWEKMSLVSTFSSKFKTFVNDHCPPVLQDNKWMPGKEQMISRLMKQGIVMIDGLQHIQVEKAILSIGTLAPAVIKKINRLKTEKFKVQWDNSLSNALTLGTDTLTMMIYNEELDQFVAIPNIGNRVDKYAHFSLPKEWDKGRMYFWSMWKAADGSVHSTSCFHGMLELVEEEMDAIESNEVTAIAELEIGRGELETGNLELEMGRGELETEHGELETEHGELGTERGELETGNGKLKTGNGEQKTRNGKQWTPPGYIRKLNKPIIKKPNEVDNTPSNKLPDDILLEEDRSILEALKHEEEQKE